jgi:Family of unknown function (DUF6440)
MYYYLVFCILAGAGLVHLARRERSKPVSAVRKTIPTRNDPWVWWARYLIVLFVAAVLLALSGCARDDSDPVDGRSGMTPRTDALTGCQYLTYSHTYGTSITPRMDRDGKQVCK